MSIASEILRLQSDSAAIAAAIEAKGVTVPSGSGFDDYASLIAQISGGGGGGSGEISDYVQSGLVMHLDGINKGDTSGRWTSLVGSTYYTLNSHSTSESSSVLMDGAGYISATSPVDVTYTTGTIEVCAQLLDTNSCVVVYGTTNSLGFAVSADGFAFGILSPATDNKWNLTKPSLFTVSLNSTRCRLNGTVTGTIASSGWGGATSHTIGGRVTAPNYYYAKIRIYAIRIYNRLLTAEEMLKNQKVDDVRFELGLNI